MSLSPQRLRLTAAVPSENDLHAAVADALAIMVMPPAEWTIFAAGHVALSVQAAAKLAHLGLKRNWPDILIVHRCLHGLELKRHGGSLRRTRTVRTRHERLRLVEGLREAFPRLERVGMQMAICDTVDAVLAALAGWGVPLRGGSIR